MNSVSTVTNASRRSRSQAAASASVSVINAGGGKAGTASRGIGGFYRTTA